MEKLISGKVREVYQVSEKELAIVTTDRISAFDVILPDPVPRKGIVLNGLSSFWFRYTQDIVPNHMISEKPEDMPAELQGEEFKDRTILVKKLKMLDYEFIIRGYMFGSMWEAYKKGEDFSGFHFDPGYRQAEKLKQPIVTPSSKAKEGHDEYITMESIAKDIGSELAEKVTRVCLELYHKCYEYAAGRGIIIADTKLEFGLDEQGNLVLADEVFTPDSSRFWSAEEYEIGTSPMSYDKQFVRDWLIENHLNGVTPPPHIPQEVLKKTQEKYEDCLRRIVG